VQGHILSKGGVALSLVMKNGNVKSKVGLGWFGTLAARCLIFFINFFHLLSGSRNNNILQLGTILNNEASKYA